MTDEQIKETCDLMTQTITKELGLRCGHYSQGKDAYFRAGFQSPKEHDFYVDLPFCVNGNIKARLFAKDDGSHVCVYGTDFVEMRKKIRAHERETARLGIYNFEVYESEPKTSARAVWCRFWHQEEKKASWYARREQVVQTLKAFLEWLTAVVA